MLVIWVFRYDLSWDVFLHALMKEVFSAIKLKKQGKTKKQDVVSAAFKRNKAILKQIIAI